MNLLEINCSATGSAGADIKNYNKNLDKKTVRTTIRMKNRFVDQNNKTKPFLMPSRLSKNKVRYET